MRLFENASRGPDVFVSTRQSGALPELAPVDLNFGNQLQVTGLRFTEEEGVFRLALRWRCLNPAAGPYRAFAHVVDREGKLVGTLDHEILRGAPPVESWQPGDQGYEARYLVLPAAKARGTSLRLGLFHPETRLRVPLWGSTFPLKDDYTAAVVEPNQEPGGEYRFRLEPAPLQPCDVQFERGVRLTGYSLRRDGRTAWLRLHWLIPAGERSRLYFFGHAVASQDRETAILLGFDQDLGLDRQPRPRRRDSFPLVQDVVRDVSGLGPEVKFLRAGLFDVQMRATLYIPSSKGAGLWSRTTKHGEPPQTEQCEFLRASDWFSTLPFGDTVYAKFNCEGSEIAILRDLLVSGQFQKITRALVRLDALKIPGFDQDAIGLVERLNPYIENGIVTTGRIPLHLWLNAVFQ